MVIKSIVMTRRLLWRAEQEQESLPKRDNIVGDRLQLGQQSGVIKAYKASERNIGWDKHGAVMWAG